MKALRIEQFGPLENLHVSEVQEAPLPAGCVRIAIEAAGVNPSDTGVALGHFAHATLPRILGRDFSGRIVEGPEDFIGTAVWGSGGGILGMTQDGSHAEHLLLPLDAVIARPSNLTAEAAAVAGVPFVTAWSALVELGRFQAGEWAIVSGAGGAVGSAAVALVKALGGHAIAIDLSKVDLERPLRGLNVDAVLRSDADDVPKAVLELTAGRGANVALNAVGAPVFAQLAESLAIGGRMVVFSAAGGRDVQLDLFFLYRHRLQLFGLDTAQLDLAEIAKLYERFGPLFESGALTPPPIAARFPLSAAREAYERVAGGVLGKVVLIPPEATEAQAESAAATASLSRADAESPVAMV
ncbi:MAG TPA: zinc-binding alcohol dehydrogenase family protein [Candidatus Cybelea sp.]|nr:zinc-binding alcohol dehydrogenase family protein [Candidatus Cybelea sp.]